MFNDPNDKPFEMKSQKPQDIGDNTPVIVDSAEATSIVESPARGPKSDRVLWYTIGGIAISACIVMILLAFTFYKSARTQVEEIFTPPQSTFTPRPAITPNLTATQRAWGKPNQFPSFASAEEAKLAAENDLTYYLEQIAITSPESFPEINQPGDIYVYELHVKQSMELLWDYGWCTTTKEILDQNFAQMKVEFIANGSPVSQTYLTISESQRDDGGQCRNLTALITNWPPGQHQLEVRVTFLQPTDDGWNLYPVGMHMFKYFVFVEN